MSKKPFLYNRKGSLEVICGPMFSGKSEELMKRLRRAEIAGHTVITIKNALDDRYSTTQVVSHDGKSRKAFAVGVQP